MSMYLDITGIDGESKSPNPNWNSKIEIHSMAYHVHQSTTQQVGSGLVTHGSNFGHMHITKTLDKSTSKLLSNLAGGKVIKLATIRVSRAGGNTLGGAPGLYEAETYTLGNVRMMSYHTSGQPGPGGLPLESWKLSFTAISEVYQSLDESGNLMAPQPAGYDIAGGTPIGAAQIQQQMQQMQQLSGSATNAMNNMANMQKSAINNLKP